MKNKSIRWLSVIGLVSSIGVLIGYAGGREVSVSAEVSTLATQKSIVLTVAGVQRRDEGSLMEKQQDDKKRAAFANYQALAVKALLSDREKLQLKEELGRADLIQRAHDLLLAAGDVRKSTEKSGVDTEAELSRLNLVEYLSKAMGWTANPNRSMAIAAATEVIQRDVRSIQLPNMVKRSLAGDQIELYQALEVADPQSAKNLKELSMGAPDEKLIAYAIANLATKRGHL